MAARMVFSDLRFQLWLIVITVKWRYVIKIKVFHNFFVASALYGNFYKWDIINCKSKNCEQQSSSSIIKQIIPNLGRKNLRQYGRLLLKCNGSQLLRRFNVVQSAIVQRHEPIAELEISTWLRDFGTIKNDLLNSLFFKENLFNQVFYIIHFY